MCVCDEHHHSSCSVLQPLPMGCSPPPLNVHHAEGQLTAHAASTADPLTPRPALAQCGPLSSVCNICSHTQHHTFNPHAHALPKRTAAAWQFTELNGHQCTCDMQRSAKAKIRASAERMRPRPPKWTEAKNVDLDQTVFQSFRLIKLLRIRTVVI